MANFKNFIMKHKMKLIIAVSILIVLFIFFKVRGSKNKHPKLPLSETTVIKKKDFVSSVSESGKVLSEKTAPIYAEKTLPVSKIHVKVGDVVKKGDIIAKLDDSNIKQQIAQKKASMSSSSKNASVQIKSAKDKLNEALRHKEQGTTPGIVSAKNSITSAYDSWQAAEKTYEDFKRSIDQGYNDQITSSKSNMDSLQNALNSANLNYAQSQDKINKLKISISNNRSLAAQKYNELNNLKDIDRNLDMQMAELQRRIEANKTPVTPTPNPERAYLEEQLKLAITRVAELENEIAARGITSSEHPLAKQRDNLRRERDALKEKLDTPQPPAPTPNTGSSEADIRRLEDLKRQSTELKERISTVQGDAKKFEGEAESEQKTVDASFKELEQQQLALDTANKNIATSAEQNAQSSKTRQDTLTTYRKSADALKNSYDIAQKSLELAKIAAEDEIKSLKNSLTLANAGADNSINAVDLKYLNEDLEKTVIKAPADGTITEVNLVAGQTPTDYVAKIETINRVVVESQVKEFDLNRIKTGMTVDITSDSVGLGKVFKGTVESIAPTPAKKEASNTSQQQATNEVVYKAKIVLTDDSNAEIKPGMTVRVKYILDRKDSVYTVPTNAIYDKNGKKFVLVVGSNIGVTQVEEIEIKVVGANDFETVVTSNSIRDNLHVINTPDTYSSGMTVDVQEQALTPDKAKGE